MCDCLPICCVSIVYTFEARLLFLYHPFKNSYFERSFSYVTAFFVESIRHEY